MSRGSRLWLQVAAGTGAAAASLLALSPERPELRLPSGPAAAGGLVVGLMLFLGIARRRPRLAAARCGLGLLVARWTVLGVLAANEEVLWRRALLGELLRSGSVAAVAGSALLFALAHRSRPGLHLGTGAVFGGLYLATGVLTASIAAHWTYNLLLSSLRTAGDGGGGASA